MSVSHLSQSQLVGDTNTSLPELGGGGGGGGGGGLLRWGGEEFGGGGVRLVASFSYQLPTDIAD